MKTKHLLTLLAALTAAAAYGQRGTLQDPPKPASPPPPPPRVWENPDYYNPFVSNRPPVRQAAPGPVYVYDQKLMGGAAPLVTQEQAQTIINRFKEAYPKLGSPRYLIYVNRELLDEQSGLKLIKREERTESTHNAPGTNAAPAYKSNAQNTYQADGKPHLTLADKQTVRDVERLFGRPLRAAGATLVDQKVASQLIADRPLEEFTGTSDTPQARKDREALAKVADAVIEILISSKNTLVPTISDSQTIAIPDIQATVISLKDSKILAQATSADITNRIPPASLGQYSVNEITEATALALMEDLTPNP